MNRFKFSLGLLVVLLYAAGCNDNPEVPKLVPIESFDSTQEVQNITGVNLTYPSVDILLVIDGSASMTDHQANMQRNIDQFVDRLTDAKLNYHIAVTIAGYRREDSKIYPELNSVTNSGLFHHADPTDAPPYYVTKDTPRGLETLKKRIRVGTDNDGSETFFGPVLDAIEHSLTGPENAGFFREDAYLVPIFFTDTEDQTRTGLGTEVGSFFSRLVSFKGSADLIVPYSVHIPVSYGKNPPCPRDPVPNTLGPSRIEDFLRLARGTYYDICADDFGVQLSQLSEDLIQRVATTFELKEVPDPDTIVVRFGDIVIPRDPVKGWFYFQDTNKIQLGPEIDIPRQEDLGLRVEYQRVTKFRN